MGAHIENICMQGWGHMRGVDQWIDRRVDSWNVAYTSLVYVSGIFCMPRLTAK